MLHTRQPQTEEALARMAVRNQARAAIVIRSMGAKYVCHPVNRVQRKNVARVTTFSPRSFLDSLIFDVYGAR